MTVPAAVAAADVATAAVGAGVLRSGGNAADAAVASALAACAAETIYTGLAGGGFAVHWDAARQQAEVVDFFVTVPGRGLQRDVGPMTAIHGSFGSAPGAHAGCTGRTGGSDGSTGTPWCNRPTSWRVAVCRCRRRRRSGWL